MYWCQLPLDKPAVVPEGALLACHRLYCSFQIHGSSYNWLIVPLGYPTSVYIVFFKHLAMFLTAGVLEDNSWRIIPSKTC